MESRRSFVVEMIPPPLGLALPGRRLPDALGLLVLGLISCGGDDNLVVVSGRVTDASTLQPSRSAEVDIVGTTRLSLVDGEGRYQFELVPGGQVWLRTTAPGAIPVQRPLLVPWEGINDFGLDVLPANFADRAYNALSLPPRNVERGIVALHFLNRSETGGEGAIIDLVNDGSFSFDASFRPTVTSVLPPGEYDGLIFTNVARGEVTSTIQPGTNCALINLTEARGVVRPDELTRIDYSCPN